MIHRVISYCFLHQLIEVYSYSIIYAQIHSHLSHILFISHKSNFLLKLSRYH